MTGPRVTLGGVMVAVVVVAANLGLVRAAYRGEPMLLLFCGLPLIGLQVAAWRGWPRDGRPGRAFWRGYLAAGGLLTGALAWSLTAPDLVGPMPNWGHAAGLRSELASRWAAAAVATYEAVYRWCGRGSSEALPAIVALVGVMYAPQVAAGVAGGLIGRRRARRRCTSATGSPARSNDPR